MPFTLAHPAVLFPLLKGNKYFSATALIIGSMVPDVEFIAQMQEVHTCSHSFPGVFLFNIPVGIFLCWLFHAVIKYFLIPNIPFFLQARFQFILDFDWLQYAQKNKLVILTSLGLGIASHLAWDAFTHDDGWFVILWPVLKSTVFFLNREMSMYHALQILSSVLGLVVLLYMVWRLPVFKLQHKKISWSFWFTFGLLVAVLLLVRFYFISFANGFWDIVIALMGIAMYAITINSLCHLLLLHKLKKPEP